MLMCDARALSIEGEILIIPGRWGVHWRRQTPIHAHMLFSFFFYPLMYYLFYVFIFILLMILWFGLSLFLSPQQPRARSTSWWRWWWCSKWYYIILYYMIYMIWFIYYVDIDISIERSGYCDVPGICSSQSSARWRDLAWENSLESSVCSIVCVISTLQSHPDQSEHNKFDRVAELSIIIRFNN